MGNKFGLPVNKKNFEAIHLIAYIEQWIQNINDDTEKEITRSKVAGRLANFKGNMSNTEMERFVIGIYEDTQ